jgi:predicted NAD/FAD-binding protein
VVIATHSDQALRLLADASPREREVLGSFAYQDNDAVLHTDTRMLPRRRRAWASWNYHLQPDQMDRTTVTYHMNRLQSLHAEHEFCVTLNRTAEIDPEKVIRAMSYAHPVYTPAAVAAQQRHSEISGQDRTHFCGAYWGWGFHEDGVRSGVRVAGQFGASL